MLEKVRASNPTSSRQILWFHARHGQRPWIVIVEPDADAKLLREKSVKTVASPDWLLIVDYGAMGRPVGVEITAPQGVPLERLNQILTDLGEAPLAEQDYKPVRAA